jgi:oligopeptide/dipeptide ABC transporter ATP-binding protein
MTTLLKVENLRTWFDTPEGTIRAVDGVDFAVNRSETLALLGESGCGKSITALSLLRLVPEPAGRIVGGHVWLGTTDLLRLPERAVRAFRGRRLAMIFQEPQTSLNAVLTVGEQIVEAIPGRNALPRGQLRTRAVELLRAVGIADPEQRLYEYPHQLSGGMKQRVMIATALAAEPELLVADEPTTALDVTIQAQILDLLKELQRCAHMAVLLITHDLGVVAGVADRVAVMYAGQIVEQAARAVFFTAPQHPYSQKLFRSLPGRLKRGAELEVIRGNVPRLSREFVGCRFAERCDFAWERCRTEVPRWLEEQGRGVRCHLYDGSVPVTERAPQSERPAMSVAAKSEADAQPLLSVRDLKVHFPIRQGLLQRVVGQVQAVDGVSFEIGRGRTLALVGESGCGKTTVGKGLLQLLRPTAGNVVFEGQELTSLHGDRLRRLRRRLQVVFQDPYSSLNPRMTVGEIVEEGLRVQGIGSRVERAAETDRLLGQVGLPAESVHRYPHEFSGGQRQRISIARVLALQPHLIVCDEPTSALDVSVQAQILNLLKRLQDELALSYLFITHNISVVEYLAHEVAVMYLGRIVEKGGVHEVLDAPKHPYTQALLAAVPTIEGGTQRPTPHVGGDIPSPSQPPRGCHFHPRCRRALPECREAYPGTTKLTAAHEVRCHLYGSEK